MIKFFRKIRQNLLLKNKIGKYLFYALGEIILVVIGILIALNVNNRNEKNKTEEKVLLVFQELLEELESNINSIKDAGIFYQEKDSLAFLVLNTDLDRDDYKDNFNSLYSLTNLTRRINLSDNAYNKLINMSEDIPNDYSNLMRELDLLHKNKLYVDLMDNRIANHIHEIIVRQIYNNSWQINNDKDEMIDYFNSDIYKSDVKLIDTYGNNEHFQFAFYYMQKAIPCYIAISEILNNPINQEFCGFDTVIADKLVGDWTTKQAPGLIITCYIEDNKLMYKSNVDKNIGQFYFISKTKFINSIDRRYNSIVYNDNEITVKLNGGVVFTKTKS